MAKKKPQYGPRAIEEVGKALHEQKRGQQRSGTKGKAKSRKQAIAIGLAKARKEGAKAPEEGEKTSGSKRSARSKKKASAKGSKANSRKSSTKKSTAKKSPAKKKRTQK